MKQLIAVIVLTVFFGGTTIDEAKIDIVYAEEKIEESSQEEVILEVAWTEERIKQKIDEVAEQYNVNPQVMHKVIKCESSYNPNALGDGGKSRGLVQIHSDYHDVSDEDAYNPQYAIEFLARMLSQGKGNLWTCYRK